MEEGIRVITVGHEGLKDGSPVRVVGDALVGSVFSDGQTTGTKDKWTSAGNSNENKDYGSRQWPNSDEMSGNVLPDSVRKLMRKYRSEGRELPDSLKAQLRKLRGKRPKF